MLFKTPEQLRRSFRGSDCHAFIYLTQIILTLGICVCTYVTRTYIQKNVREEDRRGTLYRVEQIC